MLKKLKSRETTNSVLLAFFLVGLGLVLYSTYQYFDTRKQLADIDEQREQIGLAVQEYQDSGDTSGGVALAGTDVQLRRQRNELIGDQNTAIKSIGVGIVIIAVCWLIFDVVRSHRRKVGRPVKDSAEKS